jgi:glycosidase
VSLFVSDSVRRRLGPLAAETGKLELDSFRTARELVTVLGSEGGAAELNALSLLEEAVRHLLLAEDRDDLLRRAERAVEEELGREGLDRLLSAFGREFGLSESTAEEEDLGAVDAVEEAALPKAAEAAEDGESASSAELPDPTTEPRSARPARDLIGELLVFWWLRSNPALESLNGLLDASGIASSEEFGVAGRQFRQALAEEPGVGTADESLLVSLEAPLQAPDESPVEQLRWILPRWQGVLGEAETRIVAGLDLAAEEHAPRFPPGPGPIEGPSFPEAPAEAHYTEDRGWMPRLSLIAKNALVWLQQLSQEHRKRIQRLDEIPDEALATLARRGFGGLWLIGVWERSDASREIKRKCGNPEAEASAYSVRGYRIADRLGGEEAIADLRRRAAEHGLHLAADMVPNHTGVDSHWVLEHPDRFIGQEECPFPGYSFEGPDLSPDENVAIQIEDHYFDRSDAAVVFRRTDRRTGEVRYLYHGNDGTSMPWNDTAQLDYLRAETREAVIEQILEVARRFSVIRFDAAMTLTRQHFQRLWFPLPGDAGAIPSRAERSLAAERFDELMPEEFWREVVDRVAAEAPDTLLIAEAFWLLEGYFVRSLGMHRVYNSAFMHMLRDDDTVGYRRLLRETLDFDPAVLERYVNFMSNPDELTAAEQFGSGERYRGVCLLLATVPGLPMFAHGQVEGFRERYGMEYARSYHDEEPDADLVAWHESRVAPLLERRDLFAGAAHFQLFDFHADGGDIDEAVLAFANGTDDERLLVVYNHSDRWTRGSIRQAVPRATRGGGSEEADVPEEAGAALTEALGLDPTRQRHLLRDRLSGAERTVDYRGLVEEGLDFELGPYSFLLLEVAAEGDSAGS